MQNNEELSDEVIFKLLNCMISFITSSDGPFYFIVDHRSGFWFRQIYVLGIIWVDVGLERNYKLHKFEMAPFHFNRTEFLCLVFP